MKKAISIAAALALVGALAGCATPGAGPSYTPPPGYVLVPAPGADYGYYGTPYDWYPNEVPMYYQGNPFYLPYYWYGYAPYYYRQPRPCGKNCAHGGGSNKPPVNSPAPGNDAPLPLPIEPRGDMRINPRVGGGIGSGRRPVMPHVPEPRIPSGYMPAPPPSVPQSLPPPQQTQNPPPVAPRHHARPGMQPPL